MNQNSKDYYKILEISSKATPEEIKKNYRKLAIKFHPDHNSGDPNCENKFKEITEAYAVLIDPKKRAQYDRFQSGFSSGSSQENQSGFNYSHEDLFENMFRQASSRQIFEELNREFNKYGYRSGPDFFSKVLFNSALSGLPRLISFIPGPIGKIGSILMLLTTVGKVFSSKANNTQNPHLSIWDSIKGRLSSESSPTNLDVEFNLKISNSAIKDRVKKEIAYKTNRQPERLLISIPADMKPGQKLRIKEKGHWGANEARGDLILSIQKE
jgi:DnaJ-class molecular chaperone